MAVEDYDLILSVCYSSLTDHLVAASWALNDPQTANEVTEVTLLGVHCVSYPNAIYIVSEHKSY